MNKAEMLKHLMDRQLVLYESKNKDYGDSFSKSFKEFGMVAPVVRMNDKMERIKTLSKSLEARVKDESIRDTLLDLANYALMTVVELDLEKKEEYDEDLKLNI